MRSWGANRRARTRLRPPTQRTDKPCQPNPRHALGARTALSATEKWMASLQRKHPHTSPPQITLSPATSAALADMAVRAPSYSRAACFIRGGAWRQWVGLARLGPPPAPALAFREGVNVLFPGTQEIQKVHAHVGAQGLIVLFAGACCCANDRKDRHSRTCRPG